MADLITRTDHGGRTWTFDPDFRTWRVEVEGLLVICAGHRPGGRTERWQTSRGLVFLDVDDAMAREVAAHDALLSALDTMQSNHDQAMAREVAAHDALLSALDTMQSNHDQAMALAAKVHRREVTLWRRVATLCLLVAVAVSILAAVL